MIRYGRQAPATTNQMELMGILRLLQHVPVTAPFPMVVFTDSTYCRFSLTVWIHQWIAAGWITTAGHLVANAPTIQQCAELLRRHREHHEVDLRWVPGHTGVVGNEIADYYASFARKNRASNWDNLKDNRNR